MSRPHITAQILRELYDYDPQTGVFTLLVHRGRFRPGHEAGSITEDGYICIGWMGRLYQAHRLAWLYMRGEWPEKFIDHKNGIRTDNKWENLRAATSKTNNENKRRATSRSKTGLLGASPGNGRFVAFIGTGGRRKNLGTFDTAMEAHEAYLAAKRKIHEGCTI